MGEVRRRRIGSAAAALAACFLFLLAPSAFAAPPANDDFAEREVLSGDLPLEVSRTNVEATRETGEFIQGLSPAGHSVWFEWEATSSGWVTIGGCDSDFPLIAAIFTGTAVNALTPVISGNAAEGPDCPYQQRQFTFRAQEGAKYEIAVDGNGFFVPPAGPPATEGNFTLRIEATPPPPNDSFANATALKARIDEEPDGARFYTANELGYNWGATTEVGEPSRAAGTGASVWYSWTPPESGAYRLNGPCCAAGLNWDLYGGESLGSLNQIVTTGGSAEVFLTGGTPYRIAVFGLPDLGTGEPSMQSFSFLITASLPPLPSQPAPGATALVPASDTRSPETTISKSVLKRLPPVFLFRFHSSEPGSTFRCGLDKQPLAPCPAVKRFGSSLEPGRHVLRVVAVDPSGKRDPTPATTRFRVPKARS